MKLEAVFGVILYPKVGQLYAIARNNGQSGAYDSGPISLMSDLKPAKWEGFPAMVRDIIETIPQGKIVLFLNQTHGTETGWYQVCYGELVGFVRISEVFFLEAVPNAE